MSVSAKISETRRGPNSKSKMSKADKITLFFWRGGRKHKTLIREERQGKKKTGHWFLFPSLKNSKD